MKVAFVKFGGLSAGGTERFLQNLAVGLPKEKFEVDGIDVSLGDQQHLHDIDRQRGPKQRLPAKVVSSFP